LNKLLEPLLSQEPAAQLIRYTARKQWRLLALNFGSSVLEAGTEASTMAVVFLALQVVTSTASALNSTTKPLGVWWPAASAWLNGLSHTTLFLILLALAVLLQALQSITRYLNKVSAGYFAARCKTLVTRRIHSQVLSFSFACASSYKIGDLTNHAGNGPDAIRTQIEICSKLILGVMLVVTYLAVLVAISPWLVLGVALMVGLITLLQKQLLPRITAGSKAVNEAEVAISSRITEDFQGLRLLHTSGELDTADQHLSRSMGHFERQLRAQARRLAVVEPFSDFMPILAIALIASMSMLLLGGRSTGILPSMVTFVVALKRLNGHLSGFATLANQQADNSARMKRLNQILSLDDKQFRHQGGLPFRQLQREIRFESVDLRYAPDLPPALAGISFTLPKGQMLALVGPSGAGKSSIADLLTGLYAPSSGKIWIDDTPLDQFDLSSWQHHLGVVSQDTFLFNATIAENIAFGSPGATLSQIEAACQAAQACGFIESLPMGYDTMVGERGYRLSGGQRQRLSLARAILRNPQLLILDEATSALDSQSERLVQEAIERFVHNHTVLVIAHRLSTIVQADHILVLDHGRVVEHGSHARLLAHAGIYAQLWQQQTQTKKLANS